MYESYKFLNPGSVFSVTFTTCIKAQNGSGCKVTKHPSWKMCIMKYIQSNRTPEMVGQTQNSTNPWICWTFSPTKLNLDMVSQTQQNSTISWIGLVFSLT
jgi:hypothetical protein